MIKRKKKEDEGKKNQKMKIILPDFVWCKHFMDQEE